MQLGSILGSNRVVLVNISDRKGITTAVYLYSNGVIDERLPGTQIRLVPHWALQDPQDYMHLMQK